MRPRLRSTVKYMADNMNEEEYVAQRVDDQIAWYDEKSHTSQRSYKWLRVVEIIAAAAIPFLSGYISAATPPIQIVVGFLGFLVAVIAGLIGLCQFQEKWINYRTTCESLRHEKYLFLTKTDPYDIDVPFPLFVQRVESLISTENTRWSQMTKAPRKERRHG